MTRLPRVEIALRWTVGIATTVLAIRMLAW